MLNFVWGFMILVGVLVASFTGNVPQLTTAIIESAKEAVSVAITFLGVMSMWCGVMKIAQRAGLIGDLSKRMLPFLKWLFPEVPPDHKAMEYIATNVIANILGLGWAATPAGINAMKQLQLLNSRKEQASRSMCMFMIFNMSSLQLVSVNIIAYRMQYSSALPSEVIAPGLFATLISTIVGVIFAKAMEKGGVK